MKKEHFYFLKTNRACEPGLKWAETQSDLYELWNNCHRGDWMLWLADRLQVDKRKQVLCAALCAHTVVHLMTDRRSREAVRIAFLYGRGKATNEQLREAREAAANAAVWAAARAADAAAAAAAIAAAVAGVTARQANLLRTAEIARKILTEEVMKKIKEIK